MLHIVENSISYRLAEYIFYLHATPLPLDIPLVNIPY
jgi:hypothetical protein